MSNSIWKTLDQKPDVFKPHTIMVVYEAHDEAELMLSTQYEAYTADRYINRWCYLDELLAQADKAERLEKENEAMREEFEVWHGNYKCEIKDLEIARKALEDIIIVRCGLEDFEPKAVTMTRIAENALEQISPNRN